MGINKKNKNGGKSSQKGKRTQRSTANTVAGGRKPAQPEVGISKPIQPRLGGPVDPGHVKTSGKRLVDPRFSLKNRADATKTAVIDFCDGIMREYDSAVMKVGKCSASQKEMLLSVIVDMALNGSAFDLQDCPVESFDGVAFELLHFPESLEEVDSYPGSSASAVEPESDDVPVEAVESPTKLVFPDPVVVMGIPSEDKKSTPTEVEYFSDVPLPDLDEDNWLLRPQRMSTRAMLFPAPPIRAEMGTMEEMEKKMESHIFLIPGVPLPKPSMRINTPAAALRLSELQTIRRRLANAGADHGPYFESFYREARRGTFCPSSEWPLGDWIVRARLSDVVVELHEKFEPIDFPVAKFEVPRRATASFGHSLRLCARGLKPIWLPCPYGGKRMDPVLPLSLAARFFWKEPKIPKLVTASIDMSDSETCYMVENRIANVHEVSRISETIVDIPTTLRVLSAVTAIGTVSGFAYRSVFPVIATMWRLRSRLCYEAAYALRHIIPDFLSLVDREIRPANKAFEGLGLETVHTPSAPVPGLSRLDKFMFWATGSYKGSSALWESLSAVRFGRTEAGLLALSAGLFFLSYKAAQYIVPGFTKFRFKVQSSPGLSGAKHTHYDKRRIPHREAEIRNPFPAMAIFRIERTDYSPGFIFRRVHHYPETGRVNEDLLKNILTPHVLPTASHRNPADIEGRASRHVQQDTSQNSEYGDEAHNAVPLALLKITKKVNSSVVPSGFHVSPVASTLPYMDIDHGKFGRSPEPSPQPKRDYASRLSIRLGCVAAYRLLLGWLL